MLAQEEARLLNHSLVGTEHILLGLIHEEEGVAAMVLDSLGITLAAVREKVEETTGDVGSAPSGGGLPFTPRAKKVLELSLGEALQLGHSYIGTEHLLLGLVREGDGVGARVLVSLGADLARVRQQVVQVMSGHKSTDAAGASDAPLDETTDLVRRRRLLETDLRHHVALVGRRWAAEVVVSGRRPEVFAAAYDQLAELARGLGLADLEASRLHLSSVETDDGPGLRLSVTHELTSSGSSEHAEPSPPPNAGGRSEPRQLGGGGG